MTTLSKFGFGLVAVMAALVVYGLIRSGIDRRREASRKQVLREKPSYIEAAVSASYAKQRVK
jgi:hypothetical protein